MKRSLIALAVSAAVIAPAAMAGDVTVYGRAQVEISNASPEGAGDDTLSLTDNSMGRVGFKASEDLGGGMKAMAKYEFKADTADGNAAGGPNRVFGARETMVGLKGGFGQVELGRIKSAYKYAGGVKYDPFVATTLEARGNNGMVKSMGNAVFAGLGQSSFVSDHIGYRNKFGAVKVGLTYGAQTDDGSMTLAAKFSNPMMEAFVAIADGGDLGSKLATPEEYSATKIGGQFRMAGGTHKISVQMEMSELKVGTTTTEPTTTFLGYQGKFGKNLFVAQLGSYDADTGGTDNSGGYLTIGAIHKFSKTTRVFGGFRDTDTDNDSRESVISIGVRKDF